MKRISALVGILLALFLMILPTAGASANKTPGACNMSTAEALLAENPDIDHAGPPFTIGQVLCGEFAGPGSDAIVISFLPPTCGGFFGWAVFNRQENGAWGLIWTYRNGQTALTAVGNELEETNNILGPHDTLCAGKKTTKTRVWHWDGQKFVGGPWSVHPLGLAPTFIVSSGHFGVDCTIADSPKVPSLPGHRYHNGVACLNFTRHYVPQKADLWPGGKVKTCRTQKGCGGNVQCGCDVDVVKVHPGEQVVKGRFTCLVTRTSVTCAVATGQGFTINENTVKRLPAPAARLARHCVVPNIIGKTLNRAIKTLSRHYCGIGTIKESVKPNHHGPLRVIRQHPKPGTALKPPGWVSMVLG